MRGLDDLRDIHSPASHDTINRLASLASGLVEKHRTPDTVRVRIAALNVDHEYQRPPDREKVKALVRHLAAGGNVDPLEVNQRPDGSLWVTDGQHRKLAYEALGVDKAEAIVSHAPQTSEPQMTRIVTKITTDQEDAVLDVLAGNGAEVVGKAFVLPLGPEAAVTYVPHRQFVATAEQGQLTVVGLDAGDVAGRVGLTEFVRSAT